MTKTNSIEKFIFVITYGRSGSTLLQRILQTLPNSCIRGENKNTLFPLFVSWAKLCEAKNIGRNLSDPKGSWSGIAAVDTDLFAKRLVQVFIDTVIQPPADAQVVGFKEIRYHEAGKDLPEFLSFLRSNFPNPAFVILTRDLDQVARSSWWAKMDPVKVKNLLLGAENFFLDFVSRNPDAAYHIDYSDMVGRTEKFWKLFDFLGLESDVPAIEAELTKKR